MNSTVFKYKHHYQQQLQHQQQQQQQHLNTGTSNSCGVGGISNHNNNNQNSIFILNTAATNNILPNNRQLYYSDLNENNVVASTTMATTSAASSSVWSSASATMCSPAAQALQKLFNYSSNSFKLNHGHNMGIESKTFKTKSEILKKKSKFWKYLENEDNDKNNQKGIDGGEESDKNLLAAKGFKFKSSNCCPQASESEVQHQEEDLAELLAYSCSLCDNCRCVDCQIGYFDCENSDDSNSEYSFHLSAYEEDEEEADNSDNEHVLEKQVDLKASPEADCGWQTNFTNCCTGNEANQHTAEILPSNCCTACCVGKQQICTQTKCCQQCFITETAAAGPDQANSPNRITATQH